jgi:hypothetical protein
VGRIGRDKRTGPLLTEASGAPTVEADAAAAESDHVQQAAGHRNVLEEVDELVLVAEIAVDAATARFPTSRLRQTSPSLRPACNMRLHSCVLSFASSADGFWDCSVEVKERRFRRAASLCAVLQRLISKISIFNSCASPYLSRRDELQGSDDLSKIIRRTCRRRAHSPSRRATCQFVLPRVIGATLKAGESGTTRSRGTPRLSGAAIQDLGVEVSANEDSGLALVDAP